MEFFHLLSGATLEKGGGGVSSMGTEVASCFSFSIEVSGGVARPVDSPSVIPASVIKSGTSESGSSS